MRKAKAPRAPSPFSDSEGDAEEHEGDLVTSSAAQPAADSAQLRDELRSFMQGLGLPTGATASGFDDRDFRAPPQKVGVKRVAPEDALGPPARVKERVKERVKGGAAAQAALTEPGEPDDEPPSALPPPRKGQARAWKESAGPPPGALSEAARGVWHADAAALPPLPPQPPHRPGPPPTDAGALRAEGAAALAALEKAGGKGGGAGRSGAEAAWLRVVRLSGTAADKVAAALVTAQQEPLAHGRALDALLDMCDEARSAGGKRAAGQACDALRELFAGGLMPDRKLVWFEEQPLGSVAAGRPEASATRTRRLMYWHFEDVLKRRHARFVAALHALSRDPLEWLKERAVAAAAALLQAKPEGERDLLAILVNKLGDPQRRAASAASHQLGLLLAAHPAMKGVVVRDVGHFAFRPRIGLRAVYAAVVFVTQVPLSHRGRDPGVAGQMVSLYFDLFQVLLATDAPPGAEGDKPAGAGVGKKGGKKAGKGKGGKKGGAAAHAKHKKKGSEPPGSDAVADGTMGLDSRLLRALLTGINRALPYVPAEAADELVAKVTPSVFRVAHGNSLGAAVQALTLLFQMLAGREAASDRFYRALYATLLKPQLPRSASSAMFLSLLFRALKADVNPKRVAAMVKRLLQVACSAPAPFACGSLLLVSEAMRDAACLWTALLQPEDGESAEERFTDAPLPPSDDEEQPQKRRREKRTLGAQILLPSTHSDDEEAQDPQQLARAPPRQRATSRAQAAPVGSSGGARIEGSLGRVLSGGYDMGKREPQFACAERSCLWEVTLLAAHAHPSVAAMARALMAGTHVVYDGDPLRDMSLVAFLDRWLQKKPKELKRAEREEAGGAGGSRMARRGGSAGVGEGGAGAGASPWTAEFSRLLEADVAPGDVFFHRYFAARDAAARAVKAAKKAARKRRGGRASASDSDASSSDSDQDGDGGQPPEDDVDADWAAARRAAGQAADDFGGSDDDAELDAALAAAEAEELGGEAASGRRAVAYEAGLAAAWGAGGDSDDGAHSPSGGSDSDDHGPGVFAAAEDFEEALRAGGVQPGSEEEGEGEEGEEEEDWPSFDEDDDLDLLDSDQEQPPVMQPQPSKRQAPKVTPRAAKRARR